MFVYISNQWFKNDTIPFTKATENEILKEKFDRKTQDSKNSKHIERKWRSKQMKIHPMFKDLTFLK